MHTVIVMGLGFLLLGVCAAIGRLIGGSDGMLQGLILFLPLWAIGTSINMYIGVKHAGYSVSAELPIFFVVFTIPSVLALGLRWWLR